MINELLLGEKKEILKFLGENDNQNSSNGSEKEKLKEFYDRTGEGGLSYLQRLYKQIAVENNGEIKVKFIEFYYKFLSPSIYEKNRSFIRFLQNIENIGHNFIYKEGKNERKSVFSFYNKIMEDPGICIENKLKLIKDFLQQRTDNFKDFYNKNKYNYESLTQSINECEFISIDDEHSKILYKTYPWLENILLEKIYIGSLKWDIKKYVSVNDNLIIPLEYEGIDYYAPNDTFFAFISNKQNKRTQVQENLVFLDRNGNEFISFRILLKVFDLTENTDKRLIQDEDIFQKETYFFSLKGILSEYLIESFMNNKVEDYHFKLAFDYLQKAISSLNNFSKYKNITMSDDEKSRVKNVRDLVKEIAKITVYLHLDDIIFGVFKRRLMLNYYKVDKIFGLSVEEKIPELFLLEENDLNRVRIEKYIDELILVEMLDIGQMIFKIINNIVSPNIELPKNFGNNEIQKVFYPSVLLVYYDGNEYNLKNLLLKENEDYPENDEYFTDVFLPRLCEIYEKDLETSKFSLEQHQKTYIFVYQFLEELKLFGIDLSYEEIFFDRLQVVEDGTLPDDDDDWVSDDNLPTNLESIDDWGTKDDSESVSDGDEQDPPDTPILSSLEDNTNNDDWDSESDDGFVTSFVPSPEDGKGKNKYSGTDDGFVTSFVPSSEDGKDKNKYSGTSDSFFTSPIPSFEDGKSKNKSTNKYNYAEIDNFENNKTTTDIHVACDNCGTTLNNKIMTTYQHSSTNFKHVKKITICIDCCQKLEVVDF